jgi:hypothetical protein
MDPLEVMDHLGVTGSPIVTGPQPRDRELSSVLVTAMRIGAGGRRGEQGLEQERSGR